MVKVHKPSRKQISGSVVSLNPEHTAFSTELFSSLPTGKFKSFIKAYGLYKKNVHDDTSHTSVLSIINDKGRQYSDIAARTMTNLKDIKRKG